MKKIVLTNITSEATGFPRENMTDYNPDTCWKPTTTGNQDINIDLGSAQLVSQFFVCIVNYDASYYGTSAAIALKYDDNDDGNYTTTTTFASGSFVSLATNIYLPDTSVTPVTKRYWRVSIVNMNVIAEFAGLFLVRKRAISEQYELPDHETDQFYNRIVEAGGGRTMAAGINSLSSAIIPRTWMMATTGKDALRTAHQDSGGRLRPLILSEGSSNRLVRFADDKIDPNKISHAIWKPKVTFEQVPYIADGETL